MCRNWYFLFDAGHMQSKESNLYLLNTRNNNNNIWGKKRNKNNDSTISLLLVLRLHKLDVNARNEKEKIHCICIRLQSSWRYVMQFTKLFRWKYNRLSKKASKGVLAIFFSLHLICNPFVLKCTLHWKVSGFTAKLYTKKTHTNIKKSRRNMLKPKSQIN